MISFPAQLLENHYDGLVFIVPLSIHLFTTELRLNIGCGYYCKSLRLVIIYFKSHGKNDKSCLR